jgi:GTPase SAR1 family protein
MATKKSGKSVIINSFLQKEYAPTSLTLPTPNAIIYEGWDKDYIELKIESDPKIKGYEKEQIFKFHSHEETREKIDSLFREAKIDDESSYKIPDMHLKLPQHLDYIIIDTPGPDLAGAEHKSIADKWMKEADAIIFASDFSKHLTNDEIKFLKDIRETLAKYDKFHSLIFTINKIDMRYQDSENKSIVKFVDFFRRRLEEMEYKGIPVMATSALEYFNVFELKRVLAKYNIKEEINYKKFDSILDELSDNSDDDLDTSEETIIDNVEGNLRKLKRFVKIKNPDLDDLIAESGMPLLLKRTDYIAKTKANVEIFKYLFRKMDNELSAIKNES